MSYMCGIKKIKRGCKKNKKSKKRVLCAYYKSNICVNKN